MGCLSRSARLSILATPRDPAPSRGLAKRGKAIDASGHRLGQRLAVGDRYLAPHGFHQELLVAADAQAFDGRDRQRDTNRFEAVARRGQWRQLDVDRRHQGLDAPLLAGAMERRNQLGRVAARDDEPAIRRHEIEAGGQRVDVGHVQLVFRRQALPDADSRGAARARDQDPHASLPSCRIRPSMRLPPALSLPARARIAVALANDLQRLGQHMAGKAAPVTRRRQDHVGLNRLHAVDLALVGSDQVDLLVDVVRDVDETVGLELHRRGGALVAIDVGHAARRHQAGGVDRAMVLVRVLVRMRVDMRGLQFADRGLDDRDRLRTVA